VHLFVCSGIDRVRTWSLLLIHYTPHPSSIDRHLHPSVSSFERCLLSTSPGKEMSLCIIAIGRGALLNWWAVGPEGECSMGEPKGKM
jgi:hypothetical protein